MDDSNLHFESFRNKRGGLPSVIQGSHGGCNAGLACGSIVPSEHAKAAFLHFCLHSGNHEHCGLSSSHSLLNSGNPSLLFLFFIAHAFPSAGVLLVSESRHVSRGKEIVLCRDVIAIIPGFSSKVEQK